MKKGQNFLSTIVLIEPILLTAACTQTSPQVASTPTGEALQPTRITEPSLPSSPTPLGGASARLGPLPRHCPAGPVPNMIPQIALAVGTSPVWAAFQKAPLTLEWIPDMAMQFHTPYGWAHKFLWIVDANHKGSIMLQGANLQDGSPLLPEADTPAKGSTLTALILDPQDSSIPAGRKIGHWIEFPGGLIIPKAGCYYLEATWSGGNWRIPFAAGEVSTYTSNRSQSPLLL